MPTSIAADKFVEIEDPPALAASLRSWAEAAGLLGTVPVAGEGIKNLFLAGAGAKVVSFLASLRGDPRFMDSDVKSSQSGAGMGNACQLDGGILGYFKPVGGFGYKGRCFMFDARMAIDAALRPFAEAGAGRERAAA